jgi:hypothetical protein
MRRKFAGILIVMCIFILGAVSAAENKLAIADTYKVNFSEQVRVADTLLPKGNYEIRHVMEGSNHIMVFRQLGTKKPVEVRAKCTLVPLSAKASESQTVYVLDAANQRVLQELVFRGEGAKHVF